MDQFSEIGALFTFSCSQFDCRLLLKLPKTEVRATTELTWGLQNPTKPSAPFMRVFLSWTTHPLTWADAALPLSTFGRQSECVSMVRTPRRWDSAVHQLAPAFWIRGALI